MNKEVIKKIRLLNQGKVVRFSKNGMYYKFSKMDTMACVVITPSFNVLSLDLIQNINCVGYCTLTEAELLIEHLFR